MGVSSEYYSVKCSMGHELWRNRSGLLADDFACYECAPGDCHCGNGKVERLRLNRHGHSWASRPQEAILGEPDI